MLSISSGLEVKNLIQKSTDKEQLTQGESKNRYSSHSSRYSQLFTQLLIRRPIQTTTKQIKKGFVTMPAEQEYKKIMILILR